MKHHRSLYGQDHKIGAMLYKHPETPFVSLPHQKPISRLIFASRDVPEGWMAYTHPEGVLYFVHAQSVRGFDQHDIMIMVSQTRICRKRSRK